MRIIDPGHIFELDHLDGLGKTILDFVKRVGEKFPGNKNPHEGVISQDVLRALISRTEHIQERCYWPENELIRQNYLQNLWLLESRAKRTRGEFLHTDINQIHLIIACPRCGHVECSKHL